MRRLRRGRSLALELVYLPHWLVVYETLEAHDAARLSEGGRSAGEQVAVLVCRLSGQAARIGIEDLAASTATGILPPRLESAKAEEQAADFVDRLLLAAARAKRRRERGRLLRSQPCAYPYWIEYVSRRGRIDFRALDAVSGRPAGSAVRNAIAHGIAGAE